MKTHLKLSAAVAALALLGGCGALRGKGPARTPVVGQRVPILASENLAEVDPALANLQVVLPLAETNADWAQPGGNPSKSMGHVALGDTLRQAWSARIEGGNTRTRLAAAPVVAGGRLYVIDVNGMVTAMAADTGATVWTAQAVKGDENPRARFGGGVSVDGNRAFATDGLGDVVAFDTADGKEVWRAKPGGPLRGAPTVANGQVYVVSQDNQLFALDQADGKVVWTQSGSLEAQGVFGVAAPATGQGTVVAGFSSGELNAYRYENGRSVWGDSLSRTSASTSVSALADIDAEPVIDNGRVYAVGQGAHGRARTGVGPASVGTESRRHLDAMGRGRMDFRRDRRCPPAVHLARQRQAALGAAAPRIPQRQEAQGPDKLGRPGAGRQPPAARQFRRAARLRLDHRRQHHRDTGYPVEGGLYPVAGRRQRHAVPAGRCGAAHRLEVGLYRTPSVIPAQAGIHGWGDVTA